MNYIKGVSKYCDNWRDALNELQVMIEGLKAENSVLKAKEQKWIPCSERLPEEDYNVLVTDEYGDVCVASWFNLWTGEEVEGEEVEKYWHYKGFRVNPTAWMPLPQPYKEGEKDG